MPAVFVTKRENGMAVETLKDQVRIDPANNFEVDGRITVRIPAGMAAELGEMILKGYPEDKRMRALAHQLVNAVEYDADDEDVE